MKARLATLLLLTLFLSLEGCGGKTSPGATSIVIAFAGDTFFDRRLLPGLKNGGDLFRDVRIAAAGSDFFIVNLETPISSGGTPYDKPFVFRASPDKAEVLSNAGINIVALANNHMMDYGVGAILDTREILTKAGIAFTGAGTNLAQASQPVILEKNGIKIGFLSFGLNGPLDLMDATPKRGGTAPIQLSNILPILKALRPQVDFLIVALHDGEEYFEIPIPRVLTNYRAIIDAGADLIIGHHPHILEGIEKRANGVIFYSMGNLLFDQKYAATVQTMIGKVKVTKQAQKITAEYFIIPLIRNTSTFVPEFAKEKKAAEIVNQLNKISIPLGGIQPVFQKLTNKEYIIYSVKWTNG
ncbi:MAG: CapA family protein [Brevinematales bacterium]|nr:CapA family protein [Brevinematales bacterium]